MSVEIQILVAMRDAATVAGRNDKNSILAFNAVSIPNFPRTPTTAHRILGREEEEHLKVTDFRLDFFRSSAIRTLWHRHILPVNIDLPSIFVEVTLQPLCEFGVEVTVA